MRTAARLLLALAFLAPVLATGAPVPKEKEKTNAEKVVGKWKLAKSSYGGEKDKVDVLIVEFTKDGKMTVSQGEGDDKVAYEGTYKVDGDKLPYKLNIGGGEKAETLTIKKLTDDELSVVDPDSIQEDFKRVVEKKAK